MKARVSFDFDMSRLAPEAQSLAEVEIVITRLLLNAARATHKGALGAAKSDDSLRGDEKVVALAGSIRGVMATLMAQANMTVVSLPDDAPISVELPFERST